MSDVKVLNCRLNKTLTNKLQDIKNTSGLESDAECVRYLINMYEFVMEKGRHNQTNLDFKIEQAIQKIEQVLPKVIEQKFNGKLPTLKEQRNRLIA